MPRPRASQEATPAKHSAPSPARRASISNDYLGAERATQEYAAIASHYAGRHAERSGVPYIVHIDEGLLVLRAIQASDRARRAFCLHPLVQADDDLAASYPGLGRLTSDPLVLALALEYRHIANATLSTRHIDDPADIPLGPLTDVHDMLRADKVQNYKDFLRYHHGTHPRSAALETYFRRWLARLDIDDRELARLVRAIEHPGIAEGSQDDITAG